MGFIKNYIYLRNIGKYAKRLHEVQLELKELRTRSGVSPPNLVNYCKSTTTFPHGIVDVISFLKMVLTGKSDGRIYSKKLFDTSESKTFWTAMKLYCDRMITYTSDYDDNQKRIEDLLCEENELKKKLGID